MKKIIKISNKEYTMQSSAYTQFAYKNETGRSLLADLKSLISMMGDININDIKEGKDVNVEQIDITIVDKMSELLLKIAYVMILEADKSQIENYESFLKGIDNLYDDMNWLTEVLELGITPISGQLQNS